MATTSVSISTDIGPFIEASIKRRGAIEPNVMYKTSASYFAAEPRELPSIFSSASDGTVTSENYEDWLESNWDPISARSIPKIVKSKSWRRHVTARR